MGPLVHKSSTPPPSKLKKDESNRKVSRPSTRKPKEKVASGEERKVDEATVVEKVSKAIASQITHFLRGRRNWREEKRQNLKENGKRRKSRSGTKRRKEKRGTGRRRKMRSLRRRRRSG